MLDGALDERDDDELHLEPDQTLIRNGEDAVLRHAPRLVSS